MLNVYVAPACVCGVKTVRPAGTSGTLETAFENCLLMRVGSTHLHVFTHLQSCTMTTSSIINPIGACAWAARPHTT